MLRALIEREEVKLRTTKSGRKAKSRSSEKSYLETVKFGICSTWWCYIYAERLFLGYLQHEGGYRPSPKSLEQENHVTFR